MILPIVLFLLSASLPAQSPPPTVPTYYVDPNYQGSDPDWFDNIQDAVDAGNLSQVIVYPGTYHENVVIQGDGVNPKQVHLVSRDGPNVTIIDGGQNGAVVSFIDAGSGCGIQGFRIMNGTGRPYGTAGTCGGGIFCVNSAPEIENNIIWNNSAEYAGGGIFYAPGDDYTSSGPTILRNSIYENTAAHRGGGICCYDFHRLVTITNNNIYQNSGGISGGGGLYLFGSGAANGAVISRVEDNCIYSNFTTGTGCGAGIWIGMDGVNKIIHNEVHNNISSADGGGVYLYWKGSQIYDRDILDRNYIHDNQAQGSGGGICIDQSRPVLTNNAIRGNKAVNGDGGGLWASKGYLFYMINNSLNGNSASLGAGGGFYLEGGQNAWIENTIVWGNSAGTTNELAYNGATPPYVNGRDVENPNNQGSAWPLNNNRWADPLFKDLKLHIRNGSPCKDNSVGDNNAPFLPPVDFDGEPRIYNGQVDIGSDEVQA